MNGAEQQSLPGMDLDRVTFPAREALERYRLWAVHAPPAGETAGGAE